MGWRAHSPQGTRVQRLPRVPINFFLCSHRPKGTTRQGTTRLSAQCLINALRPKLYARSSEAACCTKRLQLSSCAKTLRPQLRSAPSSSSASFSRSGPLSLRRPILLSNILLLALLVLLFPLRSNQHRQCVRSYGSSSS